MLEFLHTENKTKRSFCICLNFQKLIAVLGDFLDGGGGGVGGGGDKLPIVPL